MKRVSIALAVAATFTLGSEAQAQQTPTSAVDQELQALVLEQTGDAAARGAVRAFLDREDVQAAAAEAGIEVDRLKQGVETLTADQASRLAERVQDVEQQLAGGDTLVISATAVIIALLVIILILVA